VLLDLDVKMALEHVLCGYHDVALALHNTRNDNGKVLDEHLAGGGMLRDGRISRLSTFMSDIPMVKAFFG
jgi:hypothetical protein